MISFRRYISFVVVLLLLPMNRGDAQKECKDCDFHPTAFHGNSTSHCSFRLSCKNNRPSMLEFPAFPDSIRLPVTRINYKMQMLSTSDPDNCLPRLFLKLFNSSIYPFRFNVSIYWWDSGYYRWWDSGYYRWWDSGYYGQLENITFFDCSSVGSPNLENIKKLNYLAHDIVSCPIVAIYSSMDIIEYDLLFCTKMLQLSLPVSLYDFNFNDLTLSWSKSNCEAENFYCKHKIPASVILPTTGSIVLVLVVIALFFIYRYFRMKGDDQVRVEKFLKDYRELKPTRFSYYDLKRITNHFKDKLGEGAHGKVFKGKLSNEILVAVKILNNADGDGQEFINEVGIMGKIHHVNVVRLLGFCADGFYRALVFDFFSNCSLQNFISAPDNIDIFLGWEKLQKIAIGIARGIEYLHQGCDHRILHFDINPHNVLLDHNFTPKISDFGLAKLCSKNRSTVSMTIARGTLGYMAPEVFSRNFGNVSYKSDIYSYGMLLLEMVGGRKNTHTSEESFQVLYPEWIHNLIEGGDIHIHIEDEEGNRIAKKLAIVGLWCIQWHPVNRPSIKTVIQMLEGEGEKLKVPPTPFDSTTSASTSAIIPTKHLNLELEVIHEVE